jgi:HEAT repeat protein
MSETKRSRARREARLAGKEVDSALNRLFTQDLPVDEAEPLIEELRPMAADLAPSLVTLLNSPDRKTRTTASALLSTFEEPSSVPLLRKLLDSTGASDQAKLSAYSVLQTLGEPLDPIHFVRKLRDPEALFTHGIDDLLELVSRDGELAELVELMESMPRDGRAGLLAEVGARAVPATMKLFTTFLWSSDTEVVATAIEQLRRLRDPRAVESLLDLAAVTRRPELAEAARAAAVELRMRSSACSARPACEPAPATRCHASFIDGDGAQMILLVGPGAEGDRMASLFLSDHRGLADCFGTDAAGEAELAEMLHGAEASRIGWVAVDLAYCRARVTQSRQLNIRQHRRLPPTFEIWKDLLGPEPRPDEATVEGSTRDLPPAVVAHELPRTEALFERPEFGSWLFSGPDLAPFLPRIARAISPGPRRGRAVVTEARVSLAEDVVSDCVRAAAGRRPRAAWRTRLQLNAELYRRSGEPDAEQLCLVAAAALDDRSGTPPEQHPFLRQMARASFIVALTGED